MLQSIKHLNLKTATWKNERCASMRFISRCCKRLNRYEEAKMWLKKALIEAPYLRDPYIEMAILEYDINHWNEVIKYCKEALKMDPKNKRLLNNKKIIEEKLSN